MLSPQQIEQYHQDGFITPDFVLPADTLQAIKDRHAALVKAKPQYYNYCPALLSEDAVFADYCNNKDILDMVAQLIGEDIALWNSSFFAKPARDGIRTPWHQDGEYWPIRPLATCTAWLAVDDSTPENGCLRVIRGSHKSQRLRRHHTTSETDVTLNQELDPSEYNIDEAVDIVLKAGQISLHDVYLLHGSEANHSEHSRRGMTMRFMPTTSLFDRNLARQKSVELNITDHSSRPVYLMRGVDRSGQNEFVNI
ncbi:MAG: phytanoyl-CoA dioxygenase family protein [Burkholderiaceae bacterium]